MNCEICHKSPAQTAISLNIEGEDRELYVCENCAKHERVKREKKRESTRRKKGLPPNLSMTVIGNVPHGEPPPPIVEAIANAFSEFASEIEKRLNEDIKADGNEGGNGGEADKENTGDETIDVDCGEDKSKSPGSAALDEEVEFDTGEGESAQREFKLPNEPLDLKAMRINSAYIVRRSLHLGGLYMLGELEAVLRATSALDLRLEPIPSRDMKYPGHLFTVYYRTGLERAKCIVREIIHQERNARNRLKQEMPRVFGDSLCRALAMLKNCRMLSYVEYLDMLASIRLGAIENVFDGTNLREITRLMERIELPDEDEEPMDQHERDLIDSELADRVNALFEDVVLNENADRYTE